MHASTVVALHFLLHCRVSVDAFPCPVVPVANPTPVERESVTVQVGAWESIEGTVAWT